MGKIKCALGATMAIVLLVAFIFGISFGINWLGDHMSSSFMVGLALIVFCGPIVFIWMQIYMECQRSKKIKINNEGGI